MKWVTREDAKVDRIACPWLIRRFVDPEAEFLYVPADKVRAVAQRENAIPYDVPDVELGHKEGRCSFESIMVKYGLTGDPGLVELARIVHAADVDSDIDTSPEGRGLQAHRAIPIRKTTCFGGHEARTPEPQAGDSLRLHPFPRPLPPPPQPHEPLRLRTGVANTGPTGVYEIEEVHSGGGT